MHMAGVQIKMRKHIGLNHQKSVVLYGKGMTIFGSSNWTGPSSNSQGQAQLLHDEEMVLRLVCQSV